MKRNKFLSLAMALVFTTSNAFAASIGDDNVDLGKPTSSGSKSITFKGPTSKKKLSGTQAGVLSYDGNSLSIGDGANTADKIFTFDKGASSPFWKYNFSTGGLETGNASSISHSANSMSLGDGTSSNKTLTFNKGVNSPSIRYNSTTSKLEFSNDNSLFKNIGSGSGSGGDGGVNLLSNGGFEDGISLNWTSSGGTFSQQTYTNGTESNAKFGRLVATTSGQYFETTLQTIPDNFGAGCMANAKFNQGGANFTMVVLDNSSNTLASQTLTTVTAWTKSQTLAFPCPAAGSSMKVRFISTAAGTLDADDIYLGSNQGISQIAQARIVGTALFTGTSSCSWTTTSTSFGNFSTNASCVLPITSGDVGSTGVKTPSFTLNARPGTYMFVARGSFFSRPTANGGSVFYRFSDGTNSSQPNTVHQSSNTTTVGVGSINGELTYSTPQTVTINIQGAIETSGLAADVYSDQAGKRELQISVYYFPSSAEYAYTPEQSKWLIDANLGGANFSVSGIQSTYTEQTNGSLDLVINTAKGSATAEVPCSSTNPSTGLTCAAGNESVGIVFTPPFAGLFEVCTDFWYSATNGHHAAMQLVETPNNAQTILQEGDQRTGGGFSISSGGSDQSMHHCGTFNFANTSKRTIRLMYESADANTHTMALGRDANLGQRDMHITVRPLLQNVPRPVLTGDQLTTPGATRPVLFSAEISSSGTVLSETGGADWINGNCSHPATGVWLCNFNSVFSATPICVANRHISGAGTWASNVSITTIADISASSVYIWATNAAAYDDNFYLMCHGVK